MHTFLQIFKAFLLVFVGTISAYANIVYVDVNPDQTTGFNQFNQYDLNGSATNDLLFNVGNSFGSDFIAITRPTISPGTSSVQTLMFSGATMQRLAAGDMIGATGTYVTGNTNSCSACIRNAIPWSTGSNTNVYVGFKFTLSPQNTTHYGWALVDVNITGGTFVSSIIVKEFGWEDTPNTGILAGDKGVVGVTSINVFDPTGGNAINTNGGTLQLDVAFTPANASNTNVNWASLDPTIATVNAAGLVQAVTNGTVQIGAQSQDNAAATDFETIVITNQTTLVTNLVIYGQGGNSVANNSTLQMLKTTTPTTATDSSVTWSIANGTGAATINPTTGVLTATGVGTVTVTAVANDGSGISDSEIITINPILVTNLVIYGQGGNSVANNSTLQMLKTTTPTTATDSSVTWSIANGTGAATINPTTGVLTATGVGTVTVTAVANDGSGISDSEIITINPILVTSIAVQGQGGATSITTNNGTLQMLATVLPANASNNNVTWSISAGAANGTINATTGILTATNNGNVTVRATAQDGSGVFGERIIAISNQVTLVSSLVIYGQGGNSVANNSTLQMLKTTTPTTATDSSVTWSIANGTGAATINPTTGLLTATGVGTVTVTAVANDGSGISDSEIITINPILVTNLVIYGQGGATTVNTAGGTLQMLKTTTPTTATDSSVTWSVANNTGSAVINTSTGVLTGNTAGTVTVTAIANDGSGVTDSEIITVVAPVILVNSITVQGQGGVNSITTNGGTLQMQAFINPTNASNNNVTWSISAGAANGTVDPNTGILTATNNGNVTVRATAQDGSGVFGEAIIAISNQILLVTNITVQGQGGVSAINTNGGTLQMLATVLPTNANNNNVTWSISAGAANGTINATTGILTATNNGNVTVRATAQDGSGVFGERIIAISNQITLVSNITVQGQGGVSVINTNGGTLQMIATVLPANASNTNVTWSISAGAANGTINATTGVLTAAANGTLRVRATAQDGSGIFGERTITISNQVILITDITVQGQGGATTITSNGGSLQMIANILPTNATNQNVTWSITSGGTAAANINVTTGVLTAVTNGTVIVRATAQDGSGEFGETIIVLSNQTGSFVLVNSIVVQGQGGATTITTNAGSLQMEAIISPITASNQNITWSVIAGTGTANISSTGLLRATTDGTVTVRATAQDGSGEFGEVIITLSNQSPIFITAIQVFGNGGQSSIVTNQGQLQMVAVITPNNATNQTLTWTVDNPSIATISATGRLQAVNNGTILVTATAQDGTGISGSAVITVSNQSNVLVNLVQVFSPSGSTTIAAAAGQLQLEAYILPNNASNQNVTWAVNDPNLATVDATGMVTAINNGVVTITATAQDGSGASGSLNIQITNQSVSVTNIGGEDDYSTAKVYPNPFQQQFTLELEMKEATTAQIIVTDIAGKVLQQQNSLLSIGNNTIAIESNNSWSAGIYFVRVRTNSELLIKQIVKK